MDYEDAIGVPGAMTVHPTGSQSVTVATFAGPRKYVPFDIRPWPERIEARIRELEQEIEYLQREMIALRSRSERGPVVEAALNWSAVEADSYA
jgi:hypothetical protein